ncbi:hypothetical protein KP509_13G015200 [Ceratopteris richardii]|nr:hypothetical protein KP509_13G015200 [Ceratopteris richardii]
MNVMTQMLLSKRFFGCKDAGPQQSAEFLHITHQVFWLLGLFNIADYLPFLRWFDLQGYERLMRQVQKQMDVFHSNILQEHRLEHEARGDRPRDKPEDFVDILLSLRGNDGKEHLDDVEMKALIQDMIAAAIDTSSVTSEWAMSEMMKNPQILRRAQEEVDRVVGADRCVEESDLMHLSFLRSIVKETFRLHPPGPFLITHEATKDTEVAGYHIPQKTQLFVNTYALGRSHDIWSERTDEFWPDRWMDNQQEKVEIRDEKLRIIPFSVGRRRCPGAPLGQCMVLLALATLIHAFDWSLPPPLQPHELSMEESFGLTLPRAHPLVGIAMPRLPNIQQAYSSQQD